MSGQVHRVRTRPHRKWQREPGIGYSHPSPVRRVWIFRFAKNCKGYSVRRASNHPTEPFRAASSHASICSCDTSPACCCTSLPFAKTAKLGIPRTSYRAASCGCCSVSTFSTIALPAMSAAVRATFGAAILHGPHHSAQKSTSTGTRAVCTTSSKSAASAAIGSFTGASGCLHAPQRPVSAR